MFREVYFHLPLTLFFLAPSVSFADSPLNVVATLPDLAAIAQAIGGDAVRVTAIASGIQDPHFVDPKPSYVVKLRDADLLLVNGLELEVGWVPPLLQGARNPKINSGGPSYVDCSKGVPLLDVPTGDVTRAQGDVHPFGNPHYLTDPLNLKLVAETVTAALSRIAPGSAAAFSGRKKIFVRSLDQAMFGPDLVDELGGEKLDRLTRSGELESFLLANKLDGRLGGWMEKMKSYRGRKIVFFHRSYSYFNARFGLVVAEYVELKPGIQPGPGHLADVITTLRQDKIPLVGTHLFYDQKVADLVAQKGNAKLVNFPLGVGGAKGTDDSLRLFDRITDLMVEALGN